MRRVWADGEKIPWTSTSRSTVESDSTQNAPSLSSATTARLAMTMFLLKLPLDLVCGWDFSVVHLSAVI